MGVVELDKYIILFTIISMVDQEHLFFHRLLFVDLNKHLLTILHSIKEN